MNISTIGYFNLSKLNYGFTGKNEKNEPQQNHVSKPNTFITNKNNLKSYEDDFLDSLNERKVEIYQYLDLCPIENDKTTSDIAKELFDDTRKPMKLSLFHKTLKENIKELTQNGFSPSKIINTEFGPGFYFGTDEESVQIYHGRTLRADYQGITANGINLKSYNRLNSKIINSLMDYLNIKVDFSRATFTTEIETLRKFANEYVRQKIVSELGIDGAFAENSEKYFVVFNPKKVSNIGPIENNMQF